MTSLTSLECLEDNLYKGCGGIRNHPQLLSAPAPRSPKQTHRLISCCRLLFFIDNNSAKKVFRSRGEGNMEVLGTCGRVVIAGRILLPVFCCRGMGAWGGGVTSQNRWNGVQKRTRGLCRSHKQKNLYIGLIYYLYRCMDI